MFNNKQWSLYMQSHSDLLFTKDVLFLNPYSLCVECMRGEKSSTRGVRQLLLQRLGQRRRRREDGFYVQRDIHKRDDHHRCWQGDDPAHSGRQKWEGGLHEVLTLAQQTQQLFCLMQRVQVLFQRPLLQTVSSTPLFLQFYCFFLQLCIPSSLMSTWFQSFPAYVQTVCCARGPVLWPVECCPDGFKMLLFACCISQVVE